MVGEVEQVEPNEPGVEASEASGGRSGNQPGPDVVTATSADAPRRPPKRARSALEESIAASVEAMGYEFVGMQLQRSRRRSRIRVYIDRAIQPEAGESLGSDLGSELGPEPGKEDLEKHEHDLGKPDVHEAQTLISSVRVEDCVRVSRQISGILDVEDPVEGNYDLEVSSPGLDRPLFEPAHFVRFSGERVRLRSSVPVDGRRNFNGVLRGFEDGFVLVDVDADTGDGGEPVQLAIPYRDVQSARLDPPWPGE